MSWKLAVIAVNPQTLALFLNAFSSGMPIRFIQALSFSHYPDFAF
jgi:hypothetical protein